MPKVGKKEYGYGKKGKEAAEKEAARTGKKVVKKKNPGYVVANTAYSDLGSLIADSQDIKENIDPKTGKPTKKSKKTIASEERWAKKQEAKKKTPAKGPAMQGVEAFEREMEGVGPGMVKKAEKAIKTSKEVQDKAQKRLEVAHTVYRNLASIFLETGPKGKIEAAYGETPHGKEQYKKLSSRPGDQSPVEAAKARREKKLRHPEKR